MDPIAPVEPVESFISAVVPKFKIEDAPDKYISACVVISQPAAKVISVLVLKANTFAAPDILILPVVSISQLSITKPSVVLESTAITSCRS